MFNKLITCSIASILLFTSIDAFTQTENAFPEWKEGYFDIHHINNGGGNSTFCIFPDATTMLIDAGVLNEKAFQKYHPLKISPLLPTDSLSSAGWIVHYINQILPITKSQVIDYALITHFHSDHYGDITKDTLMSESGKYRLTGITEVGDKIAIRKLIDRNYPEYNYPIDLREQIPADKTLLNYIDFVSFQVSSGNMKAESLKVGSTKQIALQHNPTKYSNFNVLNVKSGGQVINGDDRETYKCIPDIACKHYGKLYHENQLSIALKFTYGHFDYYTGGDNTGLQGSDLPTWFDVETPIAKAVGPVDVATLDHHGNRDACNEFWTKTLQPQVFIQQSWCSDQPGQEVFYRLSAKQNDQTKADIFATYIHEETKTTFGPWFIKSYKSMNGHVVVRVMPEGKEFYIYVLDDKSLTLRVLNKFGPYISR